MSLVERLKSVRTTIKQRIENELGDEIKSVVIGSKERLNQLRPPFVWLLPVESPINSEGLAIHEVWSLDYWVIAVTKGTKDLDDAKDEVEELAVRAVGSLLINPNTGKQDRSLGNLVSYIKRVAWSPAESRIDASGESMFGAGILINITLQNEEVN